MKLAVFDDWHLGAVSADGQSIRDITEFIPREFDAWGEQRMNWLIRNWDAVRDRISDDAGAAWIPADGVVLRAVNPAPGQIIGLPSNFRTHLGEIGAMTVTKAGKTARDVGFFLIAPSSVTGAGESFLLPGESDRRFDHECEVGVVIGRGGRDIPREKALDHVFGYTALVDATMRIVPEQAAEDRSLRKSFRSFTPVGPWIVTADEIGDFESIESSLSVNGEERQRARMSDMIVGIAEGIELVSSVVRLEPGDIIASGTPGGVGPLTHGDTLRIEVDRIGSMSIPVLSREQESARLW
jgi:2-keto-4-pentenoate hydratase/2-oxohepta-3-ene-1,7-dioic acid hydratase in catechol pathway